MDSTAVRRKFRNVYIGLLAAYSLIIGVAWASFGVTQSFNNGKGNYSGVFAAIGGMTPVMVAHCSFIVSYVMTVMYATSSRGRCSFYSMLWFQSWYPGALVLCGIACVVVSVIFGIRYADRYDAKDRKNTDKVEIMGIINVVIGCVVIIVSSIAVYFGACLRQEFERAKEGEGAFASSNKGGLRIVP